MKKSTTMPLVILFSILIIVSSLLPFIFIYVIANVPFGEAKKSQPPPPEITYREFPFELVYEIDGKTVTVEDAYVSKYKGADWNWNIGWRRVWDGYIKSSGEKYIFLKEDSSESVYFVFASQEHKFGAYQYNKDCYIVDHSLLVLRKDLFSSSLMPLSPTELFEKYKVKVISFKMDDPIENSFEQKQ